MTSNRLPSTCFISSYIPLSTKKAPSQRIRKLPLTVPYKFRLSKPIRLGAYGDPASDLATIPILTQHNWTGFTHQWRSNPQLKDVLMASVDSIAEYHQAKKQGWRCYRYTNTGEMLDTEIQCLFYTHGKTCQDCGLCDGNKAGSKAKDIVTNTI